MSLLANIANKGMRLPLRLTRTMVRLPPSQLWLKKWAALPLLVASTLMRRQALQEGSHSLTTCMHQQC